MDFENSQTLTLAKFILKDIGTNHSAWTLRGSEQLPKAGITEVLYLY